MTCSYVVERVGGLVDAAVQQLVDAELLDAASYLVGSAAQEVIGLKRGGKKKNKNKNQQNAKLSPSVQTQTAGGPFCSSWTA